MPAPSTSEEVKRETLEALRIAGSQSAAAKMLGIPRETFRARLKVAQLEPPKRDIKDELAIKEAPDPNEPIEELLKRKRSAMRRAMAHEEYSSLIPVSVKQPGPIGLLLVGDPHVDDDGCDIERLERDLTTVGNTPAFFAGHIGDLTNNWVGRLAALYAHQSTTFNDGLRLTEWMLGLCPNLFVVGGNHDAWSNGMDLIKFIMRQQTGAGQIQPHGARMALRWPDGKEIRIHARHDFPGHSQYNPTHGHRKETLWGHRDHILVAGHRHTDAASVIPAIDGTCHWFFRVSGYKVIDEYAKQHHFQPQRMAPSTAVILNPDASCPAELVKPFWDTEAAADYLTYLRGRK